MKITHIPCVENCSNNAKSQPNPNFYILLSDKQRCRRWLQALCRAQHRLVFCTTCVSWTTVCKGSEFLQFCDKGQSNMHQIFTKMYFTVSIGPSHMESSMELFIKKFFFRWSPNSSAFGPLIKNPPKQVGAVSTTYYPPHIHQNNTKRLINPVGKN